MQITFLHNIQDVIRGHYFLRYQDKSFELIYKS